MKIIILTVTLLFLANSAFCAEQNNNENYSSKSWITNNLNTINFTDFSYIINNLIRTNEYNFAARLILTKEKLIDLNNIDASIIYNTVSFIYSLKNNDNTSEIENLLNEIKKIVLNNPKSINLEELQHIYENLLNESEKEDVRKKYKIKIKPTFHDLLECNSYPKFITDEQKLDFKTEPNQPLSKQQLILNYDKMRFKKFDKDIQNLFLLIYSQEKIEHANGYYTFVHGRHWSWNLISDIYKNLWNITKNDNINESFQFLRFGTSDFEIEANVSMPGYEDILFMNATIFGNLEWPSCCSPSYFLENFGSGAQHNESHIQKIFKKFNLEQLYLKYQKQFEILSKIHSLYTSMGEMLLISIPSNKLNNNVGTGSSDITTKEILDKMRNNIKSIDMNTMFHLILGKIINGKYVPNPYTNDPHNGPAIYSFHMGDEQKMEEYKELRDEIFAKIKADIECGNTQLRSKL
ncbi:MAG: hypothetical protein P4L22_07105 [Candidatus Babeliales bacterium]|nr:hypothetical protein [Candidatus Babeliales bacterium]